MGFDIRLPIGLTFVLLGVLIGGYGLLSDPAIYARSLGFNVNLWWGLVLLVFGVLMLALWHRSARRGRAPPGGS
jgi:hypothetical protein